MSGAGGGDEDVLLFQEGGERRIAGKTRMVLLKDAHMPPGKQLLPADARNEQRKFSDGEIDLAGFERGMEALQTDLGCAQAHVRRGLEQFLHHCRQQHDDAGVQREDAKHARRLLGIEAGLLVAKALKSVEQCANRLFKLQRLGGRLHVQGDANEQGIAEIAAKPRQCLAQRRLLRMQRLGGARQAAFAEQHVEDPERVQVEIFSVLSRSGFHISPGDSLTAPLPLR